MEQKGFGPVTAVALAGLLGAGAFWNGLYAPAEQLVPAAVLAAVAFWVRGAAALSRLEAAALALVGAGAGLSLLQTAATGTAAHGPVVVSGWLLAFWHGRRLPPDGAVERVLGRVWAFAATFMVFAGLAAFHYLPPHHSGRLAAFLGYPIAVGVLGMLGVAGSLEPLREGRWWAPALAFGSGLGLFLSGSRGVWAAAVLLAGYLLWVSPALLRRAWRPLAVALAAALWAGPAVALRDPVPAVAAALAGCMMALLTDRFRVSHLFRTGWVSALAATAVMAPGWSWLLGRATALPGTEGSSVERFTFLRDGLALVRDLPLGAGYRAWTPLHLQRASYGYYSAEVHSAPLDLAIAFGWAGAAGFLLLLVCFLAGLQYGRNWSPVRAAVLAGLGALGVHALVDWDLSFGIFMVPLWLGFGILRGGGKESPVRVPFAPVGALAALALAAAAMLGAGDIFTAGAGRAMGAGRTETAYLHASMATGVNPWNDLAHAEAGRALSGLGQGERAVAAFDRARRLNPYEPWYAELQAAELVRAGRLREAAAAYRDLARLWPWHAPAFETALQAHMDLVIRAETRGDAALAQELAGSAREILAALDRQKAKEPPGMPRRPLQTHTPALEQARRFLEKL